MTEAYHYSYNHMLVTNLIDNGNIGCKMRMV